MNVTVELPDAIAYQLRLAGPDGGRQALEMFAVEGYRTGRLSRGQVSELLDLEFNETERFLKDHNAALPMTFDEFQRGDDALRRLLAR